MLIREPINGGRRGGEEEEEEEEEKEVGGNGATQDETEAIEAFAVELFLRWPPR